MSQDVSTASSAADVTPLIRRIQRDLLTGRVLSMEDVKYVWAPREALLPDLDPTDPNQYQAVEAGVFREHERRRGDQVTKVWLRLCSLDDLDEVLGQRFRQLSQNEREAISVDLTFQGGMAQDQVEMQRRRQVRPR